MADLLNVEKLQLFLVVLLPGFVAIKVFDLLAPPEKRDFGTSINEAIVYGLINLGCWAWLLVGLTADEAKDHPIRYSLILLLVCVFSPTLLAISANWLRRRPIVVKWLGDATPSAWDDFFNRKRECWVICHLKSGQKIGGLFSQNSYATIYPKKPELFIEKTYYVDQQTGKITGEVQGSVGLLVRYDDCNLIEFLEVERPNE